MKIIKDALIGAAIIIIITVLEFLVTVPFLSGPLPENLTDADWKALINMELLLTAIPAGMTTFFFAWVLKTRNRVDAQRRSLVWGGMGFFNYMFIGFVNGNLHLIFGSPGVYVLTLAMLAGPMLYYYIHQKRFPASPPRS
jgi:membrane protease YdiL (CAAX protease family)